MAIKGKFILIILIIFCINLPILSLPSTSLKLEESAVLKNGLSKKRSNENPVNYYDFVVKNTTYYDSCYKGTDLLRPMEWWYFDATFDNGYSLEFNINLVSDGKIGFVLPFLNLYKDCKLISTERRIISAKNFVAKPDEPIIKIDNKITIKGYKNYDNGWIFNIKTNSNKIGLNLTFTSYTPSWKSKILTMWWWGVIQPKAIVNGTITLKNEIIIVNGTGYQEHGWKGNYPLVKGWFWGKFVGETLNLIWSDVIKYPWEHHRVFVINEDFGKFEYIPVKNIQLEYSNYRWNHGWKLPTCFKLIIDYQNIKVNILADTIHITHQQSFGLFNYWRYHVHVKGYITYGEKTEYIDDIEIMDWTRFY